MAIPARTDALDVIVELLAELDSEPGGSGGPEFYDRLCAALCSVANMQRAGLLLYDEARQLVVPVGSHGIEAALLRDIYGTLEETPIAQVALSEDRVVEVTDDLERWVPERYAHFAGIETLTCTPVSAGGRWLGVIFADRGGGRFELTEAERHAMWTLGKTAALAASVRIATSQQGRARLLQARIDLAREIHERVVQRLFGVSLVLGSEHGAQRGGAPALRRRDAGARSRTCATRSAARWRRPSLDTGATLREELARLGRHYKDLPLELDWEDGRGGARGARAAGPVGAGRGAAQRRQARRADAACACAWAAATAPSCSRCATTAPRPAAARAAPGMGLRLAAVEALERGALVEFGPEGAGVARAAGRAGARTTGGVSPERNLRVLVVDDHDVVHWGFRLLLTEQPWVERCLTASSEEEALELARRYEPHVALVDLFLGEESGAELCEAIRRESPDHARAADLRRRLDLAPGGQGGRGVGLRLQGLVGRTTWRWPCAWSARA